MAIKKVTDEWLYKYMPVVDEAMIRRLEETMDETHEFSKKFERKMERLIWKEEHPWVDTFYRFAKRAAIFMACFVSASVLLTMSVEAYRVKFFERIKTFMEDSVLYTYFTEDEEDGFLCMEPSYIPEGYQEIERVSSELAFRCAYENEDSLLITWDQELITDGGKLLLDLEYDSRETLEINGMTITVFLYSSGFVSTYCEYNGCYILLTADELSMEEISKIFASMKIAE